LPGELLVRCQDLEEPGSFYRAYRRRLQAGFRFVYDDPRLGEGDTLDALLTRIRHMETPPEFLTLIARDPNPRIRAAAAGNAFLALDDLDRLAVDPTPAVRRGAAAYPWAPPGVLRVLAQDSDDSVREQVAAHLATPPDVLFALTRQAIGRNVGTDWLAVIAEHPRAPEPVLSVLALVPFREGWLVARRRELPQVTVNQILDLGPDRCRADLARNPAVAPAILDRLARDSAPVVRMNVCHNPSTSEDTLTLLLRDPDPAVRAANPRCTPLELTRLIDVRSRVVTEQVAGNPAAPSQLLDRLARTWDSDAHAAVAANPSTPPQTIRHLYRAGGDQVRRLCLENPSCPEDLLRTRASAQAPHWRAVVAANPGAPIDLLHKLATDPAPEVLGALARNPALPGSLQRRLLRESASLPANPLTPPEILWQLAIYENDDNYAQRRQVLANPGFAQAYEVVTSWREGAPEPAPPPPSTADEEEPS